MNIFVHDFSITAQNNIYYQNATGDSPTGITVDWAQRRAAGTLPPESDIVAGLLNQMDATPAEGTGSKGGFPPQTGPSGSSSTPQAGSAAANDQTSPGAVGPSTSASGPDGTQHPWYNYGQHQPGPWPGPAPALG